ncbi:GNAT family N-acetyltransferase [Cellulomonas bogoriensis]|uniref:GCN5 family acetyltransferase n=1 Tax=Cellulomonas bogoriensis 69B4 = DSM 16987 TaxID=1386082 RepID=A0A0A0BYD5_9CELL|nr:GNAT family N-acetyltransferase [Cellulomonas bogoriensis]KGM13408.1 GCN5 family acetyltransferase [Cellulomonas bogoriensis 69B4 = DSM 16987]
MSDTATAVRRLGEDDWATSARLRLAALERDQRAFGASIEREQGFTERHWRLRLRGGWWFVGAVDGQDVALAGLVQEPGAPAHERHLHGLWVAPHVRRRGVATRLVDAAVEAAVDDGASTVTAWSLVGDEAAARTLRTVGMTVTGTTATDPRDATRVEERWSVSVEGGARG